MLGEKQVLTRPGSFQCQVTVQTEPPPLPPPPPTAGSEQVGFLKTINCSCPAGEKVRPAAPSQPSPAAPELSGQAGP